MFFTVTMKKKFKIFNKFSTDLNNNWGEIFFNLVEDIFGQNFYVIKRLNSKLNMI